MLAANWSPYDGHNDALTATGSVVAAAIDAGAEVVMRRTVLSLETRVEGVRVHTDAGVIDCRTAVVAAGLWTKVLCEPLGVKVPLRVRNNQMMVTRLRPRRCWGILITHAGRPAHAEAGRGRFRILIGGGWPGDGDVAANSKRPNLASMVGNAAIALTIVPELARLSVIRAWAGFRWPYRRRTPARRSGPRRSRGVDVHQLLRDLHAGTRPGRTGSPAGSAAASARQRSPASRLANGRWRNEPTFVRPR